jgi:MFS superfamily sulfate permease-like transporter
VIGRLLLEQFQFLKAEVIKSFDISDLKSRDVGKELLSSLVTYLVALPLCLGVAIASGVPPVYGLITGILGGVISGVFSGCSLQITGPAGGLIVIVIEIVHQFGIEKLGIIVLFAGILQILTGIFGLAPWFQIVSPAIIRGMLSGIGVVIFASQFHVMMNHPPLPGTVENLVAIPNLIFKTIMPKDENTYHLAAGIGLVTLLIIIFWNTLPFENTKKVPPTLVAVFFASAVAVFLQLPIDYVDIPANFASEIRYFDFGLVPDVLTNFDSLFAIAALTFIASIEAILTTKAIEKIDDRCKTQHNREIIAQGLGNSFAGFLNSLPLTGVIVRSVVAHKSGGRTKWVAVFQGLWILITLLFLKQVISLIPLASLAAILVLVSFNLVDFKDFRRLYKTNRVEFVISLITLVLVITTDIFTGVLAGVIIASVKSLKDLSKFKSKYNYLGEENIELKLEGSLNFINSYKLNNLLGSIPEGNRVVFNMNKLHYIDHSCFEVISNWEHNYAAKGGVVIVELDHIAQRFDIKRPEEETPNP